MRIAVAGGTGLVGTHVVEALRRDGHDPVVLSRAAGVDVLTGDGLDAALAGAHAVVDVLNVTTTRRSTAVAFFEATTERLLAAGARAGVGHHVVLSIVGVDRVPFGYYEGKLRQERLALDGPVPATVLRATQFHEFAGQMLARVKGPVAVLPKQRIRPVAAREVGAVLAETAAGPGQGLAVDLAGPAEDQLVTMARRVVEVRGGRRPVVGVRLPGAAGKAMVSGGLLPAGAFRQGRQTFDQWLDEHGRDLAR